MIEQQKESYYIFLNKPVGITSQQCLTKFKKKHGVKKIGHHGTLDPFASGLLLVGVNEATKFFQFINDDKKTYEATLRLGEKTDTLDCTGQIVEKKPVPDFGKEEWGSLVAGFVGDGVQVPPMYSSVKHQGRRLYELAREGKDVQRKERPIKIHDIELLEWESPVLKLRATVSRGTYIRVLAEDIAKKAGTVAHLIALKRTLLCGHGIGTAYQLESEDNIGNKTIDIIDLLTHHKVLELEKQEAICLLNGQKIQAAEKNCQKNYNKTKNDTAKKGEIVLVKYQNTFLGVAQLISHHLIAERMRNIRHLL